MEKKGKAKGAIANPFSAVAPGLVAVPSRSRQRKGAAFGDQRTGLRCRRSNRLAQKGAAFSGRMGGGSAVCSIRRLEGRGSSLHGYASYCTLHRSHLAGARLTSRPRPLLAVPWRLPSPLKGGIRAREPKRAVQRGTLYSGCAKAALQTSDGGETGASACRVYLHAERVGLCARVSPQRRISCTRPRRTARHGDRKQKEEGRKRM